MSPPNRRTFLRGAARLGGAVMGCGALGRPLAAAEPARSPAAARRYVYWTRNLRGLDVRGLIDFCKEVGTDGVDLGVYAGHAVNPENVAVELPKAARAFRDEGLVIGLVSWPGTLNDPASALARTMLEAASRAGVSAVKLGYFFYTGNVDAALADGRRRMAAFAKLAAETGVQVCYHTHSANYLGNNAAGLRLLLRDLDPRHVGAMVDTGHVAVNGGPIRMELDLARPWLSLVAIKDMLWERHGQAWRRRVVPTGTGLVRWEEVALGLKECGFDGTISVHAEYETRSLAERKEMAKRELELLKACLG